MLCRGESALKGVEEAITVLEDDPCLNAGDDL
jgi:isoaspartyl peptidase/L-asparaginase-like protein (Ntn-hydrolase superfamily)